MPVSDTYMCLETKSTLVEVIFNIFFKVSSHFAEISTDVDIGV